MVLCARTIGVRRLRARTVLIVITAGACQCACKRPPIPWGTLAARLVGDTSLAQRPQSAHVSQSTPRGTEPHSRKFWLMGSGIALLRQTEMPLRNFSNFCDRQIHDCNIFNQDGSYNPTQADAFLKTYWQQQPVLLRQVSLPFAPSLSCSRCHSPSLSGERALFSLSLSRFSTSCT